jgi:hypothetical protein
LTVTGRSLGCLDPTYTPMRWLLRSVPQWPAKSFMNSCVHTRKLAKYTIAGAALTAGLALSGGGALAQVTCDEPFPGQFQCGTGAAASGAASTAVGFDAIASGADSSAFGHDAQATGGKATAIGHSSRASNFATAVGESAKATGFDSTAIDVVDGSPPRLR